VAETVHLIERYGEFRIKLITEGSELVYDLFGPSGQHLAADFALDLDAEAALERTRRAADEVEQLSRVRACRVVLKTMPEPLGLRGSAPSQP